MDEFEIFVEELDEPTCWRLLARAGFGRVGFVHDGELLVLPVNAAVVEHRVVFRTADDSMLCVAGDGSKVAFEADHTDRVSESGWSVLVRGHLVDATDRAETASWHELTVRPWLPGPRTRWMVVEPTAVTGRAVQRRRILAHPPGVSSMPPG